MGLQKYATTGERTMLIILDKPQSPKDLLQELVETSMYLVYFSIGKGNLWSPAYLKVGFTTGSYCTLVISDGSAIELDANNGYILNEGLICAYKLLTVDEEFNGDVVARHGLISK